MSALSAAHSKLLSRQPNSLKNQPCEHENIEEQEQENVKMAANTEESERFDKLYQEFTTAVYKQEDKHMKLLHSILDQFNSLNYKFPIVTSSNKGVLIVHVISTRITFEDGLLVMKCCILITNLIVHQRIELTKNTFPYAFKWIIENLKISKFSHPVYLQCLESIIRKNYKSAQEFWPLLFDNKNVIMRFTRNFDQPHMQLWAVKSIESLIFCQEDDNFTDTEYQRNCLKTCEQLFLDILQTKKPEEYDNLLHAKLLATCLHGLQTILIRFYKKTNFDLGMYLGIGRAYMAYYIFEKYWLKPHKLLPSKLTVADLQTCKEKKGGKVTKQKKLRNTLSVLSDDSLRSGLSNSDNEENSTSTPAPAPAFETTLASISDSDVSDNETDRDKKIDLLHNKIRLTALNLLQIVVKASDKKAMFGYWSSFFYDGSPGNIHNLNNCLDKETTVKGKLAILNLMNSLINGSKFYLSQAEFNSTYLSFTPFSIALGSRVQMIHYSLYPLLNDNTVPVVIQTLKTFCLLIQSTPYVRLTRGLLDKILTNVKPFINHRDATMQVAALSVIESVVLSEPILDETRKNLKNNMVTVTVELPKSKKKDSGEIQYGHFSDDDEENKVTEKTYELPWLLQKLLQNLGAFTFRPSTVPAPIKLESLQVISALSKNYFGLILAPNIMHVLEAFEICLKDKYIDLRLHCGRAIESIGLAIQNYLIDKPRNFPAEKAVWFWETILPSLINYMLKNEHHASLRSVTFDCYGSIGCAIFDAMPRVQQVMIITSLFSYSKDSEFSVRSAAVRAIAIYTTFSSLREDLGFLMDATDVIIKTLGDDHISVRIKSSWSLGNLSDALLLYASIAKNEEIPERELYKLFEVCQKSIKDNNKIQCNIVRSLGNLLRLVTQQLLRSSEFKQRVEESILLLLKYCTYGTDVKVHWNACYAIGNFMRNNIIMDYNITAWQDEIYETLMSLVENNSNFKVRINAALALSIPTKRVYYGEQYFTIWTSLANALEKSQLIEDFNEFKHQETLIDQICLTLCHLCALIVVEDLYFLNDVLVNQNDMLKYYMRRMHERIPPQKSNNIIHAENHIIFLKTQNISGAESIVVLLLEGIFTRKFLL